MDDVHGKQHTKLTRFC